MDSTTQIYQSLLQHYVEKQAAQLTWNAESGLKDLPDIPDELKPVLQQYSHTLMSAMRISTESMLHAVAQVLSETREVA